MLEKNDIVMYKNYKNIKFVVDYINKGDKRVWIVSLNSNNPLAWKVNPNKLVKMGHMG